jgi:uncharacterized membrane protein
MVMYLDTDIFRDLLKQIGQILIMNGWLRTATGVVVNKN